MLGLDLRAARITWTVFLFALLVAIVYWTRESILIFVAALILAYMIYPLVNMLHHRAGPKLSRTACVAIVFVILLATVGLLGTYVGGQAVEQAANLTQTLPDLVNKHGNLESIPVPSWLEPYKLRVIAALREQMGAGTSRALPLLQRALGGVASVVGSLGYLILVPFLAFLFLKDADDIQKSVLELMPRKHKETTRGIMDNVHVSLGNYIRSLVILAALTSVVYLIFFQSVGLPYAVLLSLLAAPLEVIPFIGPLVGTILILLVAAFTGYAHIWWIVIFFVVYRLFQDYFLQPYLMSAGVELHPLLVLFGALAGQELGGLWGMFLSVPIMATIRIIFVELQKRKKTTLVLGEPTETTEII